MTRALLLVMMDEDPSIPENDFNRWYNSVHMPERLACPGFISGRRFVAVSGAPRYLALYELESLDALETPEWMRRTTPATGNLGTEIDQMMMAGHRNVVVNVYLPIETSANPEEPEPPSPSDTSR